MIFQCTTDEDIIDKEAPLSRFNYDNMMDDYVMKLVYSYLDEGDFRDELSDDSEYGDGSTTRGRGRGRGRGRARGRTSPLGDRIRVESIVRRDPLDWDAFDISDDSDSSDDSGDDSNDSDDYFAIFFR